ncbi:uncharacterized protein TNCV_2159551 [Trichonephila clavipes]|nr:uncharacterized protein TNCV_2159551 [Trichonephila clavipes]
MPPNTLREHTEYVLVKSVRPKVLRESITSAGDWRIFPSSSVPCQNCGGGDRWCHHLSSHPAGGISPNNNNKTQDYVEILMIALCQDHSCQVIYSQFGLAIHQNDHQARRRFVEWAQNEIAVVPDFHKRILFSDEAHFWLNGYVNKQNCRIWSEANPQVYVKTRLHAEKLTVWCALWAGGIIGPYFFKNDEGTTLQ